MIERLQRQLKKEKKGAVRELRKDAKFLAQVRVNEILENDADRNTKLKAAYSLVASDNQTKKKRR